MKKIFITLTVLISFNFAFAQKETLVLIQTNLGNIKVKLYDDTPGHKENFLKLVNEGKYDGSIFHRVIKDFMIQGGGGPDGSKDLGEQIPPEFLQKYVHTAGKLCAARMGDNVNPGKFSSGSQFYIVHGRKFAANDIKALGNRNRFPYTEEQIQEYEEKGGAPHLDGQYTVFGEVVEGMDVVNKIANVKTKAMDKPEEPITMTMKVVKK